MKFIRLIITCIYDIVRKNKEDRTIKNQLFIDLDQNKKLPKLTVFQGLVDIKKNGRILVKNSILENIDTFSEEELRWILANLKEYISPIVTSQYIPSVSTMEILTELAPEFEVRMKTEKVGGTPIIPMKNQEFWEGEAIFQKILEGINPEWTEKQKAKYLYNQTGQMLSYDLNVLTYAPYSSLHEKYARNIFTAISKNWGICSSFASIYDYLCYRSGLESMVLSEEDHDYVLVTVEGEDFLTDPTMDSVALKFGMRTQNFGVSKEDFQKSGHRLEETEAAEYEVEEIDSEEMEEIDQAIGYLKEFGGAYTDEQLATLANDLSGETQTEKVLQFWERAKTIKYVGRPTAYDWETLLKWILDKSTDRKFAERIQVYSFVAENSKELPRKLAVEVRDPQAIEKVQFYLFEDDLTTFQRTNQIEVAVEDREK